jgi:hypothetical protein
LQKKEGRLISKIISQLLAAALAERKRKAKAEASRFKWSSRRMGALIVLSDKGALYKILDRGKHRAIQLKLMSLPSTKSETFSMDTDFRKFDFL